MRPRIRLVVGSGPAHYEVYFMGKTHEFETRPEAEACAKRLKLHAKPVAFELDLLSDDFGSRFLSRFKCEVEKRMMTTGDISKLSGVTERNVRSILKGTMSITPAMVARLSKAINAKARVVVS